MESSFSLLSMWGSMGILAKAVVLVLLGMSVMSIYVMADRFVSITKAMAASRTFLAELAKLLERKDLAAAQDLAVKAGDHPAAKLVATALAEHNEAQSAHASDLFAILDAVERAIERAKERELATLRRGLGSLATIASAAPFVGLFGTVVGIINAFQAMATSGQGGLASVSGGIAEALVTTAFGIGVAVPAVVLYNVLTTRVEDFAVDLSEVGSELVGYVAKSSAKTRT
ncbi:MAG: MotA/TolQ/ExbB proton channel family protein [Deltaproteobacteria bacterium]|nr:MotA/TolQ/ExbB proton channel family protein [Deltaproteobacteria bacterium]